MYLRLASVLALAIAAPAAAKDSLGIFGDWGAFRDPAAPRCYAIAKAAPSRMQRDYDPYASVGTWPRRKIRGQVHFRLSRALNAERDITLIINDRRFALIGGGGDAWAQDKAMDAAIVAAMRSGAQMVINATDARGRRFSNTYDLTGAATAMDAATVGCARL
ncbi:invasion associated locus B family protein [Parerythrobacter aestuarii]|uniref:invasion associated locus B family protein n=1 Tax=Parerythrobacter aestuarii TaxID=3020909 RepID=UPI0024DE2650|nr:invasion associated locus B family protein [Parerythrobacter aestuarii]